jgi:cysteine-rich repeat protein
MTPRIPVLSSALLVFGCFHPSETVFEGETDTGSTSTAVRTDTTEGDTGPTSSADTLDDTTGADVDTSGGAETTSDGGTTTRASGTGDTTMGDATMGDTTESDSGNPACVVDGMIGDGEACDDDNEVAGDGCSDCWFEDGWGCSNEPSLCFPACNPLVDDCGAGYGCYVAEPTWACIPDGSGGAGQQSDPCGNINACDPGLQCVNAEVVTGCDTVEVGCCTTVCDVTAPACPADLGCTPYYDVGEAPPGLENVGVCI